MNPKSTSILSWINDFLDYWSAKEDGYIPPERRLEILRIAQQLADEDASAQTNLIAWLPPLLCKSQEQQERFVSVYETWRETSGVLARMPTTGETPFPPVAPPASSSRDIRLIAIITAILTGVFLLTNQFDPFNPFIRITESLLTIPNLQFSDSQLEQSTYIHAKNWQRQNWTSYRIELTYDTQLLQITVDSLLVGKDAKAEYTGNRIIITNGGQPIPVITADSFGFARLSIRWLGSLTDTITTINFISDLTSSYFLLSQDTLTQIKGQPQLDGATVTFVKDTPFPLWQIISVTAGILLLLLIWYLNRIYQVEVTLNKRLPKGQEDTFLSWLFFPSSLESLPDLWTWLPQAGRLQNWPVRGRKHFDVTATIKAVSAHAGNFVPIFTTTQKQAGFLVLIDRSAQRDQQADLSNALIDKLEARDVRVARYEFDEDPRQLWDAEGVETSIGTLATNYMGHYLVVFSSLSGLYDVYTGELHEWAIFFGQSWSKSYLFSPENPRPAASSRKLGRYEELSRLGFQVHPLSSIGIRDFIMERTRTVDNATENTLSHYLPATILNSWFFWSSIFPPTDSEVATLKKSLAHYLGSDGYRWLQACAPFPELHLELTTYLGQRLGREAYPQESLYDYAVLLRLLQLPWFRQGSMPPWLREALINDMDKAFRLQLKALLNDFFTSALKQGETNKSLAVYEPESWWNSLQDAILFKQFRKRQAPHSPFQEVIFADFIDDGIGVRIERALLQTPQKLRKAPESPQAEMEKKDISHQNDEKAQNKELNIWEALIPVVILMALLAYNIFFADGEMLGAYSNQIILLLGGGVAAIVGFTNKVTVSVMIREIWENLRSVFVPVMILFLVGALAGTWLVSGVIPAMVYYGLKVLSPEIFLPASVVIAAIISIATGSSWTTSATVGIALIGIGTALGINAGMIAGAVISGAYFGDKMSPLSDTTNLASAMAGTDLFTHIKYMTITTVPTILITLAVFGILSLTIETSGNTDVSQILEIIAATFNITPWLFLVPLAVVLLIWLVPNSLKKIKPLITLGLGVLLAAIFAFVFQSDVLATLGGSNFSTLVTAILTDTQVETGDEMINQLFSSGGMIGMLWTIALIICAMVFGGIMDAVGALARITKALLSFATTVFGLFASTVVSCLGLNAIASDQYLAIVIPGKIFKQAFEDKGLAPENLSRTLEDAGTVTSVLIPWNTCGAFHTGVLGVEVGEYFLYAIFNWLSPFTTLLFAALGIKIKMLVSKEETTFV